MVRGSKNTGDLVDSPNGGRLGALLLVAATGGDEQSNSSSAGWKGSPTGPKLSDLSGEMCDTGAPKIWSSKMCADVPNLVWPNIVC